MPRLSADAPAPPRSAEATTRPGPALAGGSGRRRLDAAAATYAGAVATAVEQLAGQLDGVVAGGPGALVVLPAVGFARQSAGTLNRAIRQLAAQRQRPGVRTTVVVVVNRPAGRPSDDTMEVLHAALAQGLDSDQPRFAACELVLERRPRIGELRQLAVDAVSGVCGGLPDDLAIVPMDDDVVSLPPHVLERLRLALRAPTGLALGPVLFDDPHVPMCLLVELYLTDLFRALIAQRLMEALAGAGPGDEAGPPGGGLPAPDPTVFESLVLAGNIAVRHGALRDAGGFRDLNEITNVLRDVIDAGAGIRALPPRDGRDPVHGLLREAVRMSSRRSLASWRAGRHPTVAQWRASRLRSSRPDPVRLLAPADPPAPIRSWRRSDRERALEALGPALSVTLDHLHPPPDLAAWALAQLGAGPSDAELRPPSEPSGGWRVALRRSHGLLERVDELQRLELEHAGAGADAAGPATSRDRAAV